MRKSEEETTNFSLGQSLQAAADGEGEAVVDHRYRDKAAYEYAAYSYRMEEAAEAAALNFVWRYDVMCPNEIPSDYKAYRKQQRRWSCGPMQLWAAARVAVGESTLPSLHKSYLNIFFFGVRMLATNVISFTFYSVLVPLILLVYATEDLEVAVHHRFMPWWAIVWMPLM